MRVSVRLFAGLRDRAGTSSVEVDVPEPATAEGLLAAMATTPVGPLAPRSCIVAVNREYAAPEQAIGPEDELALIPPVSGGAAETLVRHVRVTDAALDVAALSAAVRDPRAGAVLIFEGTTRDVEALDYEAYAEMAEPRLAAIAEEEAARHGLCAAAVEHRVGRVALGEASVIVAVSAPHRGEAFAGGRAIIDRLKAEAPIWKREEGVWKADALPGAD